MNEIWCWSWVLGVRTEIECKLEKPGLVVRVDCPSSPALVAAQLMVIQVVGSASRDGALADYCFVFSARLWFPPATWAAWLSSFSMHVIVWMHVPFNHKSAANKVRT